MVVEILSCNVRCVVGIGVVSPAENTRMRYFVRQKNSEPVHSTLGGPGHFTMAVEPMNSHNAIDTACFVSSIFNERQ
jgi:hypothetical protein